MRITRDDFAVLRPIVKQVLAGLSCFLVGAPVGWGVSMLAGNLATNRFGIGLSGFLAGGTLDRLLAYFSLAALVLIVVVVTERQIKQALSPAAIVKQTFKATATYGAVTMSVPIFLAGYNGAWDALAFTLIAGSVVMSILGTIVATFQVGQYWLDPVGYTKLKWLMGNKGAVVACKNGILPFQYRLQKTWEVIGCIIILLASVIILFLLWSGVWFAEDGYYERGFSYLVSIGALLVVPLRITEIYRQLYRSRINSIEGEIEKTRSKRRDGTVRHRVRISGTSFLVSEEMRKQLENGQSYRLFFVTWRFITASAKIVASEPL